MLARLQGTKVDPVEQNEVREIVKKYQMSIDGDASKHEVINIAHEFGRVSRRLRQKAGLSERSVKAAFEALRERLKAYGSH